MGGNASVPPVEDLIVDLKSAELAWRPTTHWGVHAPLQQINYLAESCHGS